VNATIPSAATLPTDVEWQLPCHARSVSRARLRFRTQAEAWRLPADSVETATLLLSELVTNAVRHAGAPDREIRTRCVLGADTLRVEVSDAGDGMPTPRTPDPEEECGRGLTLLAALASAWDTHPRPYGIGKTVWFEVPLTPEG
jgi:anti-sigma regulatory factor (Ser/Thr protein kinase)